MPDPTLLILLALLLAAIGGVAGILAGLLGVGGGIVLVSAFFYSFAALGYDSAYLMQICLATSLATIIVTSCRSVLAHNRRGAVDWSVLRGWAPGIAVGAILAVLVAAALRSEVLQALFGVLAVCIGLYMLFGRNEWQLGDTMPGGALRWTMSPVVGFLSVLMGIGGGSFGVPLMTLYGRPIHRAVATAAGFGVLIAVPSVVAFLLVDIPDAARPPFTIGAVNVPAFLIVIAMTLTTAPLGAALAHRIDARPLKRIFAAFLILVALNMMRQSIL
ncbi:Uncharacterized membrane protein YfcA [Tranquillimonas rosea]|uniref:Probable membrane transporter protein n=1 Tax=Tranquillimonas rosea TaxID=641238 RepID=A0A1H9Q0G7_9RHOB|nr:sulfite exporter TauE/SafE family protein [Tranquillimonas rosea]SER53373.1 Uncharacterized membrane protein YfcA [Tranquillimonas rosea]